MTDNLYLNMKQSHYLLQADFSVSSSGDTYCAVPTKEFALAVKRHKNYLQSLYSALN